MVEEVKVGLRAGLSEIGDHSISDAVGSGGSVFAFVFDIREFMKSVRCVCRSALRNGVIDDVPSLRVEVVLSGECVKRKLGRVTASSEAFSELFSFLLWPWMRDLCAGFLAGNPFKPRPDLSESRVPVKVGAPL